jgi:hypothetical protein
MSATNGRRGRPPFWSNSSSDNPGKRGQLSWHLIGSGSALVRAPYEPGDEQQGEWSRKQLLRMNTNFTTAMERAFKRGTEHRESAARTYPAAQFGRAPRLSSISLTRSSKRQPDKV